MIKLTDETWIFDGSDPELLFSSNVLFQTVMEQSNIPGNCTDMSGCEQYWNKEQIAEAIAYKKGQPWCYIETGHNLSGFDVCDNIPPKDEIVYDCRLLIISGFRSEVAQKIIDWIGE